MPASDKTHYAGNHRELIELALRSCIQKLAFLRGDGATPRTFPDDEREVIAVFGLECILLALRNRSEDADPESNTHHDEDPHDEDTPPRARTRLRKAP